MTQTMADRRPWEKAFLSALGQGATVVSAAKRAKIDGSTAYYRRSHNAAFAAEWRAAIGSDDPDQSAPRAPQWKKAFLDMLAQTSNVSASAASTNTPLTTVYDARRKDGDFAVKWRAALVEGYEHLEMELLAHLRGHGEDRKYDVANALRLLAAHRDTVAKARASEGDESEQAVLDSIDAFIDDMRERALANNAVIAETVGVQAREDG